MLVLKWRHDYLNVNINKIMKNINNMDKVKLESSKQELLYLDIFWTYVFY